MSIRAVNQSELKKLSEEKEVMTRKTTGLESDLKIQQQKNACFEKQLEDAESKVKQVRWPAIMSLGSFYLVYFQAVFQDEWLAYG